jgi:hypothetical protein
MASDWLDVLIARADVTMAQHPDTARYARPFVEHLHDHASLLRGWGPDDLAAVLRVYLDGSDAAADAIVEQLDADEPDSLVRQRIERQEFVGALGNRGWPPCGGLAPFCINNSHTG